LLVGDASWPFTQDSPSKGGLQLVLGCHRGKAAAQIDFIDALVGELDDAPDDLVSPKPSTPQKAQQTLDR
jgi:hypothetical protein